MSKDVFYVGIDVGQEELWVAVEGCRARRFRHTVHGIKSLYGWVKECSNGSPLHLCMEATGVYSESLAVYLNSLGEMTISIVNPALIRSFGRAQLRRTKTDAVDAQVILAFAQSQRPAGWVKPSGAMQQLHELVTQLDALKEDLQRWTNRGHNHKYQKHLPAVVKRTQKAMVTSIKRQIDKLEQALEELCQENEQLDSQVRLLCTIPGIAQLTATHLLAYGKNHLWEYSPKALTAHAGLAPGHRQSGISIKGKSHIAKQGNRSLRKTLYMPTLVAIKHNPVLRAKYEQLVANGKPKKLAVVACMRKMLLLTQTILRKKEPFKYEIITLT